MPHEYAVPIQHLLIRRRDPVAAQSGYPAAGARPQHAGTAGTYHRCARARAGANLRKQRRQDSVSDPPAASAPGLAAPVGTLIPLTVQPSKRRIAMIHPSLFLRRAIVADAIFSG